MPISVVDMPCCINMRRRARVCVCEDTSQSEVTCQARPGSWRHEALDAQTYCDADVDYLKIVRAPPTHANDNIIIIL
jgi:hypothetical protein